MAIFYGVYIEDERLSAALDLIRFFAQPGHFRRTHITVRGPYTRPLSKAVVKKMEKRFLEDARYLEIIGVGSFFFGNERVGPGQNTVILRCEIPGIRDIWNKPDYQKGAPHITVYDGESRSFANLIRDTLNEYRWQISTKISGLHIVEKKKDPEQYFKMYFDSLTKLSIEIFGTELDFADIGKADPVDRIVLIRRTCEFIEQNYSGTYSLGDRTKNLESRQKLA